MSEGLPNRASIVQSQLDQLGVLIEAILPANKFYSDKFARAGLAKNFSSLDDFQIPFTLKQELVEDQQRHPPYGANLTFPLDHYTRCHQTSGSTGTPLRWLDTPESWDWMKRNWEQVFRVAGVRRGDRVFFAFSFGPFLGFWLAFEAAQRLGCLALSGAAQSSTARLRLLLDHRATVLCCTPTYALRLAEVAAEEKIDLATAHVKSIIVAGEPGGSIPATRQRLEELWPGARVVDHHGMTEVGPVTCECPARPCVLHVMEHAYIAEVIDPATGKSVAPSQTGELVLTTLGRIGSPLLRYRTGDLVKMSARTVCVCGSSELALEGGILGRTDDMVVVRGVNLHPGAMEEIIRGCGGVAEYQIHLDSRQALPELSVQIEMIHPAGDASELMAKLEKAFQVAFSLRVPVSTVPPGTLPRFEMKARRWVKT